MWNQLLLDLRKPGAFMMKKIILFVVIISSYSATNAFPLEN